MALPCVGMPREEDPVALEVKKRVRLRVVGRTSSGVIRTRARENLRRYISVA